MTRDRRFKEVVRARMRRTGEPYTTALAHVQRTAPPSRLPQRGGHAMYSFESFTERAKRVLTHAQAEAESSGRSYIGSEHLLLGLLIEEDGLAHAVLATFGFTLEGTRQAIEAAVGTGTATGIRRIHPTAHVKAIIEQAFDEARRMDHRYVGTEHLLLGILVEGKTLAAKVLSAGDVTVDRARAEVERLLEEGAREPGSPITSGEPPRGAMTMQRELAELLRRARTGAAAGGSPAYGVEHLLAAIVAGPTGLEVLARLLEVRRIAAMKEQAIAARDYEAAAQHRADEKRAREPLEQALARWRHELEPPPAEEPGSS